MWPSILAQHSQASVGGTLRGEEGFGALGSSRCCCASAPIALPFLPQSWESSSHPSTAGRGGGSCPQAASEGDEVGAGMDVLRGGEGNNGER